MQNSLSFGGPLVVNTTIITGNMQKLAVALWKAMHTGECCEQLKTILKPLAAIVATFAGAVCGAAVLMKGRDNDNRWMFIPIGAMQMMCFVTHDHLYSR